MSRPAALESRKSESQETKGPRSARPFFAREPHRPAAAGLGAMICRARVKPRVTHPFNVDGRKPNHRKVLSLILTTLFEYYTHPERYPLSS